MTRIRFILGVIALLSTIVHTVSTGNHDLLRAKRQSSTERLVFAHFMIGISSNRKSASDYDEDMKRAKSLGIDAFALNIGVDPYTDQQLQLAYESAGNNDMKVFLSFDFNWWHIDQATAVGQKVAQYASKPAQLLVDNKVFVSSFAGDGMDVAALRAAVGKSIFFAPNFHPATGTDISPVDGLLNWMAWPNNGNNKAPTPDHNITVADGDQVYVSALGGKAYIAPVSPWFFTHFGPEVSYSKNWNFPSDLLWFNRWNEILALKPRFIEIVTWNDYGESHYIGPLNSPHTDDGASKWVNDMPHDGWLDISKPYIAAFKAGDSSPNNHISSDELVYWYRPAPRGVNCDSTDTCMVTANNGSGNYFMGRPDGWESMADSVFVVSLLTSPATVQVNSGGTVYNYEAPAGASAKEAPMGVGSQSFAVVRDGQTILSGTSLKEIINGCVCGLYNFNAYVGTLPAGFNDPLLQEGLSAFKQGLRVQSCQPSPSLGTVPPGPPSSSTSTTLPSPPPRTTSPGQCSNAPSTVVVTITVTRTPPASTPTGGGGGGGGGNGGGGSSGGDGSSGGGGGGGGGRTCIAGTGSNNYVGLCSFCCNYGYCPSGPCTCTQYGSAVPRPPSTGTHGVPLIGEDDSYLGLCSFACDRGYCPSTACRVA
ncbi:CAZyme family GH71 [Penicillium cf. viridicatum]|uniref:CAZyme family GH71 n=1 Tax=Penicillium cf. viridicatum TaxID=2972119 RepID=A0A9W9MXI1_9EURO|nr:CAZyme family GH71 [Penicillium cf. viridicatum]